jgi:hypothetical protein
VTSRINDPDRHLPGDVGVKVSPDSQGWEKVFEVRHKPVREDDLYHFAQKAIDNGVGEAAVVAVAAKPLALDAGKAQEWARVRGVSLSLFVGWQAFVEQVLFWAMLPSPEGVQALPELVFARLVELEVSQKGVDLWRELVTHS